MTTIRDIAREAKVSIGVVSRILNEDASLCVTGDTRKRVLAVIQQCNYQHKPRKSSVAKKQAEIVPVKKIGLLLATPQQEEFNDPYYIAIREGIEHQVLESGLTISKVMRVNLGVIDVGSMDLDGLIVVGNIDYNSLKDIFPKLDAIVFLDRVPQKSSFDSVISDLGKAMENALHYLFALGHKDVGFIGGRECFSKINSADQPVECDEARLVTYKKVMQEQGRTSNIFIGDWTSAGGYEVMKRVIEGGTLPSAFIVGNDLMSIGVLRALYEAKISVPEDVGIVSFDDTAAAAYLHPPLTTVKLYTEEMGRRAVLVLLERMKGRTLPLQVVIPSKLIVRESCGGKPDEHCEYVL